VVGEVRTLVRACGGAVEKQREKEKQERGLRPAQETKDAEARGEKGRDDRRPVSTVAQQPWRVAGQVWH